MDRAAGLIEVLLAFGVLMGFLVWELLSVRRSMRRRDPPHPDA